MTGGFAWDNAQPGHLQTKENHSFLSWKIKRLEKKSNVSEDKENER